MAFNIDPSISLNVKGPQALTLPDMMNLATGIQAYKQRQQLNPLEVQKAQAEADVAQIGKINKHLEAIAQKTSYLQNKSDLSVDDIVNAAKEVNKNYGGDDKTLQQYLIGLPVGGTQKDLKAWIANSHASVLSAQAQLEKRYPDVENVDIGGQIVTRAKGSPLLATQEPGTPTGPYIQKGISPQTYTTETGAPGVIGVGGQPVVGNINQPAQVNQPGQPVQPTQNVAPQAPVSKNMGQAFEAKGGIVRDPSETYEAYRERVKRLSALPIVAKESLNSMNPNSVPNMKYINDQVLKLLESKDLDIGPIQKAIVEKTGGIGLNPDQQIIQKYLEQRIRQEAARTNQDQDSQRSAFGSFGTAKPALREIIYNDKGRLASQELFQKGILNHQGDANKPNLGSINRFENEYAKLANDPNVTHLLGVIGTKSLDQLSPTDVSHLKKQFGSLSKEQFNDLFKKLDELKALSNESK